MTDIVERWTLGGYGPGNYRCTCSTCKSEFTGDKRATQCLPCAGKEAAAEIERLRAALDAAQLAFASESYNASQLRAALREIDDEHGYGLPPETRQMIRAALGDKP